MRGLLVSLVSIFCFSSFSLASSVKPTKSPGWWLIGGELGFQNKDDIEAPEVENSGLQIGVKGVYSRYTDNKHWVWDVGLGYRYDNMEEDDVEVETTAFLAELGLRYRFNERWSFGPEWQLLMGEDTSFSDTGTNSDDKPSSAFVGARLFYDVFDPKEEDLLRLGVQGHTDINIDDRRITYYQFVIEYGWPTKKHREPVKEAPAPIVEPEEEPGIKLNLKDAGVRFASGSSTLVGKSKKVIEALAKVLKSYEAEWSFVRVAGHTDITGDYKKNIQLSNDRAAAVREVFLEYGIPELRITSSGFGPDRPIDPAKNRAAYAKNRRVEINIVSEEASEEFANKLKRIIRYSSRKN